ncbi:winged helix-turn-helix domain-containing protein [Streptomyces sp. NBRC 110028]|uniref:winged helix-turn-helix domain-containing protein n=1 Tax=Streptomyces sp. NBRC 110028 TaxID=1621260 RepID=UPI00099F23F3|nr:winged helix-turn-helix domain-containing protein [Streptomyces sp. NBRC 110028]
MRRISFTHESLARTRMSASPEKLVEALFALDLLCTGRGGAMFDGWRKKALTVPRARELVALAQTIRPFPDIYRLVRQASDTVTDPVSADGRPQVVKDLGAFYRSAIAPYWKRIAGRLEVDRAARGQLLLSGGVDRLMSTLHPSLRWESPVLEVPGTGADVLLEKDGLLLVPALFLHSRQPVLFADHEDADRPMLVYPIPVKQTWAAPLWDSGDSTEHAYSNENALGALLGRTRAAVLRALTDSCTTTELGERVGISAAAASQHTGVLRKAGLITTIRTLNKVQHSLTPLGSALLYHDVAA